MVRRYWVDPLELTDRETHNEPYCGHDAEAAIVVLSADYERALTALEKLFNRVCIAAPDLITTDNHEYGDMIRAVLPAEKCFPGAKPPPMTGPLGVAGPSTANPEANAK
jgi:hypothetical protein